MSPDSPPTIDLLELKLLPAWLKEPSGGKRFEHYAGEEETERPRRKGKRPKPNSERFREQAVQRPTFKGRDRHGRKGGRHGRGPRRREEQPRHREERAPFLPPPDLTIRFLPRAPVFDSVVEQIKSGAVAYSLFHLSRLFLEKPERYEVRLTTKPESPLYQLGDSGALSLDQQFLEQNAFRFAQQDFYRTDISEGEPIKGNFTSVARDRLSGTVLGPTNYHTYQPRLRTLYEQRFSRRMSFPDFQRQIEIVGDPDLIERWKQDAQKITTYTSLREEAPATFSTVAETERHFRTNHLPALLRTVEEASIGGVSSRRLSDRVLHRAIEEAWVGENRSPSNLMQELAGRFRQAGLHIFRHRRGMLFVSPARPEPLTHEQAGVSELVNAILKALAEKPGIQRKDLAEKLIVDLAPEEGEARKLALASDLHWLIAAGHVIEFNDGSLDLPRVKTKTVEAAVSAAPEPNEAAAPALAEHVKEESPEGTNADSQTAEPAVDTMPAGLRDGDADAATAATPPEPV
jgi:hypothetical protein